MDRYWMDRYKMAQNPDCPGLAKLAEDENKYVRQAVARNLSTPPEVLTKLAMDKDDSVRYWVARNPNCPEAVRLWLSSGFAGLSLKEFLAQVA